MITLEDFKSYILHRRDAFEHKYKLKEVKNQPLLRKHYPNNLKYLDDMSQLLIRTMNNHPVPVRNKLITVFVYRMVGDKTIVRRYANPQGIYTFAEVQRLARYLDKPSTSLTVRYTTPLSRRGITGLSKGDFLLASLGDFIDKLPKDNFHKWKTSEIVRQFNEFEKVYGVSNFIGYQLATDISYINELEVRIDFIKAVPDSAREMYSYIVGKPFRVKDFEKFTYDMMKWYQEQEFLDNKERLILPSDIVQMLLGYRYYVNQGRGSVSRFRVVSKKRSRISGIVLARSMYDYYKESLDSEKD